MTHLHILYHIILKRLTSFISHLFFLHQQNLKIRYLCCKANGTICGLKYFSFNWRLKLIPNCGAEEPADFYLYYTALCMCQRTWRVSVACQLCGLIGHESRVQRWYICFHGRGRPKHEFAWERETVSEFAGEKEILNEFAGEREAENVLA